MSIDARPDLPGLTSRSRLESALYWLAAARARAVVALVLLSLACFLPGFASLQPMDRDEPRFAQASKQMLETGDFVDIRFQDEARHKKPVGIYWLQSATVATAEALGVPEARTRIFLYRLPSLAAAIGTVLATYWAALAFLGPVGALLSAALMAASILLGVEARLAKTDATLALAATLVFGGLARAYLRQGLAVSRATLAAFWSGMALGILVKGPIVLMVAGLALAVLAIKDRSLRWVAALRPLYGALFVLVAVLPWFAAILHKTGGAFLAESVGKDMLGKVGSAQEKHGAPPGFYLLAFFGTFWPAAPFAAIAAPFAWQTRREPGVALALAWIIPSWIVFELVPTKLPHYVLPLYPAIAILTVHTLIAGGFWRRGAWITALLVPLIALGLLVGLPAAAWWLDGSIPFAGIPVLAAAVLVAVYAWNGYRRRDGVKALVASVLASVLLAAGVFGLVQPGLRALKLSPRLAEAARAVGCADPQIATAGYREPSLVFLTRTDLAMPATGGEAARFLSGGGCRVAFVTSREEPDFAAETARLNLTPRLVTRVAGFNINGGRRIDIGVYAISP